MTDVLLVADRSRQGVPEALDEVRRIVGAHGRIIEELDADQKPIPARTAFDRVVVLGGDGTLIAQCRRLIDRGVPLVGVNFGRLGFLAEFDLEGLRTHAAMIFGVDPVVRSRMVLDAIVRNARGDLVHEGLAINEAAITAGAPFRMIELKIALGDRPGPDLVGDGVIVATPIGSTAYNVSAGGPIVQPDLEAIIVTPNCAHSLAFRPIVAPSHLEILIETVRANEGTSLVLDGQAIVPIAKGDRVLVGRHHTNAKFIGNPDRSYWDTLVEKMRWGAPPSYRDRGA
jgi:NAD+ kinase